MSPTVENVKDVTDVLNTQGTDRTIVAIFLILFIIAYIAKSKQDSEDAKARRDEIQHYRLWQKQRVEKLDGLNERMIEVIQELSTRLNNQEEMINNHSQASAESFKAIIQELKVINAKVDDLYSQSEELATKQGLNEVKKEINKLADKY